MNDSYSPYQSPEINSIGNQASLNETIVPPPANLGIGGIVSWMVVIAIVISMAFLQAASKRAENETDAEGAPQPGQAEIAQSVIQGKNVLFQKKMLQRQRDAGADNDQDSAEKPGEQEQSEANQNSVDVLEAENGPRRKKRRVPVPEQLDGGTVAERWFYTILLNEAEGVEPALEHLQRTRELRERAGVELNEDQQATESLIESILDRYRQEDFGNQHLTDESRQQINQDLGWFGQLLLSPEEGPDQVRRTELMSNAEIWGFAFGGFVVLFLLAAVSGFVGLVLFFVLAILKKIQPKFVLRPSSGDIYIETFAIWCVVFFGGQVLLGWMLQNLGEVSAFQSLTASFLYFFGSLVVLVWPLKRGISWSELVSDLGLSRVNPFKELGLSIPAYFMTLPLVLIGVLFVAISTSFSSRAADDFSRSSGPSHPIQEMFGEGGMTILAIFLTACVAAPIVEEIMFRGVLYRHLRDLSGRFRFFISVTMACLVNSFIFAAVHPQGVLGIPVLMGLAIGFSLAREFRNSLYPAMAMHAINNFSALSLSLFFFS